MSYESTPGKEATGVDRVWREATNQLLETSRVFSRPGVEKKIKELLSDPKFKTEATRSWAEMLQKSDYEKMEKTEELLTAGLTFRVKSWLEKQGKN